MIRSWVLGNEAHENRNGVLLFGICVLAKNTYPIMKGVIFMSIEKIILNAATHYHANLIDIHNALHALGLRSDEQAEKFNKKHMMKLVEMYERRGYDITK